MIPPKAYTEQLPVPHDYRRPTLSFIKELNNKTVDVRIALDKKADSSEKTGIFAFMENASIRYAYSNIFSSYIGHKHVKLHLQYLVL